MGPGRSPGPKTEVYNNTLIKDKDLQRKEMQAQIKSISIAKIIVLDWEAICKSFLINGRFYTGAVCPKIERRKDMSAIAIANRIKDNYTLSQKAQIVIDFLGRVSNNKTNESYYSQRKMAEKLHISYSSIQRAIRELKELGVLIIRPRFETEKNGRQTSNLYTIISEDELQILLEKERDQPAEPKPAELSKETESEQLRMDLTKCISGPETRGSSFRYQQIREEAKRAILRQEPKSFFIKLQLPYPDQGGVVRSTTLELSKKGILTDRKRKMCIDYDRIIFIENMNRRRRKHKREKPLLRGGPEQGFHVCCNSVKRRIL